MLLAIHLPDAVFIWLAYAQPENLFAIGAGVAVEQFGYGFGFTAFMLYMIYIARGEHQTAHYAICTGFMALGMMLPGMWSGWLQERLGYPHFFVWVILATIPSFIVAHAHSAGRGIREAQPGRLNQRTEKNCFERAGLSRIQVHNEINSFQSLLPGACLALLSGAALLGFCRASAQSLVHFTNAAPRRHAAPRRASS